MSKLKVAVLGIDHRHAFGMLGNMLGQGATCVGWWTDGAPEPLDGFAKRFPDAPRLPSVDAVLQAKPDLVIISSIPCDRAALAIRAMEAGIDVMTDKPGCTTLAQLDAIKDCVARTGRIWSVDFSERFEVPCVTRAAELVQAGAIGRVVQTVGLGPHRLNRSTRPDWFFDPARNGGILTDIASHQIDQFLFFTGATDAEVTLATATSIGGDFQDFGEIALRAPEGHGYIRVDWFTPDALPAWGDGRLTILGTEGTIELRKYVDVGGADGTDHLLLTNGTVCEKIDASDAGLPYFARLVADIRDRSETAMPQSHAFKVMELALRAQEMADA
jgi:predicted dehydrogenase